VKLPPQVELPGELRTLVNRAAELAEQVAASNAVVRAAEAAVREAATRDRQALADARDRGSEHPGHRHCEAAEAKLAQATEIAEADRLRLSTCEDALRSGIDQHATKWIAGVEHARERTDRELAKAIGKLRAIEEHRAQLRGAQAWLASVERVGVDTALERGVRPNPGRTSLKDPQNADATMTAPALFDVLEAYAAASSVDGERRAAAEREQAEAEAEQRRQEIAAFRGAHAPLHMH
jgi:hypothetical protein